jgi:1-acyl-sn-glycerol-3-phosphate acyltransferase
MATSRAVRALGELLVRAYPFWRVEVDGALPPPPATFVLVPNHASMADAVAVACLPREMKWMGKRSAFRFPWVGGRSLRAPFRARNRCETLNKIHPPRGERREAAIPSRLL